MAPARHNIFSGEPQQRPFLVSLWPPLHFFFCWKFVFLKKIREQLSRSFPFPDVSSAGRKTETTGRRLDFLLHCGRITRNVSPLCNASQLVS